MKETPLNVTRTCWICHQDYPLTETYFYRNVNKTDGWGTECRSCHKEQSQIGRSKKRREFVLSHGNTCGNCGLTHDNHMFFDVDHIVPLEITGDKRRQYKYDDNCQILCPNCHREKTLTERKWGKYETKTT